MSRLKYKLVLGIVLAATAITTSACTTPVTIDCTPFTCVG